jgi:hypothetical protein
MRSLVGVDTVWTGMVGDSGVEKMLLLIWITGEYEIQNRPAEQTQAASSQSNQVSSEAWPASTQSNEGKSVPRTVPAPEDVPASREDSSQYGTSPTYTYDLEERLGSMTLDKGKGRDTGNVAIFLILSFTNIIQGMWKRSRTSS